MEMEADGESDESDVGGGDGSRVESGVNCENKVGNRKE
jgi:hypothetical protein